MRQINEIVRHQSPITMSPNRTVKQACVCMRDNRIGAILITDDGSLVGILTARDVAGRVVADGRDPEATILADVMAKNPDTLQTGCAAIEALRMMQDGGYRHLPVVEDGKLLGLVAKGDFSGQEYERLQEETILWEQTC